MVDPVTLVVMGLARCLMAGLPTVAESTLDAYWQLREVLIGRYGSSVETRLKLLERDPNATGVQAELGAALRQAGAGTDTDLGPLAQNLIRLVSDPASATDPVDEAHRIAGRRTIEALLADQVRRVFDLRDRLTVPASGLLTGTVADRPEVPAAARQELVELPRRIRAVIDQVAAAVETRPADPPRSAPADPDRARADRLLDADQRLRVSYESLRLTVGYHRDLTAAALARLDRGPGDPGGLGGEALVMAELADLVIGVVGGFCLAGADELDRVHDEVRARVPSQVDGGAADAPTGAGRRRAAGAEWAAYARELDQQRGRVAAARVRIPAFEAIRDEARQQVDEPDAAALVRLLTWTADAIRTTIESLSDRRPVPLTPTRLQRLLRL